MNAILLPLLAQLAATAQQVRPVLAFPEPGIDDSAAYAGYRTRFYRDGAGNTVQIYLEGRDGRIVHLLANADDESIGFTARDERGRPATVDWQYDEAWVADSGRVRTLRYRLVGRGRELRLGLFLLGSMRVERDLQYSGRHRGAFAAPTFDVREVSAMLGALGRLPPATRRRHLAQLRAADLASLRRRLRPRITAGERGGAWTLHVTQASLDARDTLVLEIAVDAREVAGTRTGGVVALRALRGQTVPFTVRIATTARALSALTREQIFTADFLGFLASAQAAARSSGAPADATRARRLERQVRGVELLSSREKLMAGLPAYATYFGRDMLVSALMMQPIWREEMLEFAIASVLRKLSPAGEVSHEEALGGQAVREHAAEYASLVGRHLEAMRAGRRADAARLLADADSVVRNLRRTRENYHMIDDELQLPVLVARWLGDRRVTPERKRAFLADSSDGGGSRLDRLLLELALVARLTAPYAAQPDAANLVSFQRRDATTWGSASWRDSGAGYGGGRYAMDVNAIWVPNAIAAVRDILSELRALGIDPARFPGPAASGPLARWIADAAELRRAEAAWRDARRHFVVRLAPDEVRNRVMARLAGMSPPERRHWEAALAATPPAGDTLEFLALALDENGRPIAVANTDVATRIFLDAGRRDAARADTTGLSRDVRLFTTAYPVGLLVEGVGPVVANDAYATPAIWAAFERDPYHGPRVVWGREVNLFLLGVADRVAALGGAARDGPARELTDAIRRVSAAVESSGFHSELWSYGVQDGRVVPMRYGTGSDVQLWSTTELAVQYALQRLGAGR